MTQPPLSGYIFECRLFCTVSVSHKEFYDEILSALALDPPGSLRVYLAAGCADENLPAVGMVVEAHRPDARNGAPEVR